MSMASTPARCRCGHDREAHEHYRPGTDCGWCGPTGCPTYRGPRLLGRLLRLIGR